MLSRISKVKIIKEEDFDVGAELTSCAPGFITSIFQEFVNSALKHAKNLSREEISEMVVTTLYATSKLLLEKEMSFEEIIERVATKRGITEEGVKVLRESLPQVFDRMFEKTLTKRRMRKELIDKEFNE